MTIALQTDVGLQAQLELARQVQLRLLPDRRCCLSDLEIAFSYEFGQNRLAETLLQSRNQFPSELVETIQRTIIGFANGAHPSDDRTMLALRWSPKGT